LFLKKIKAVIFDLDGTLLDTVEDLADSLNIVLRQNGLPVHGVEEFRHFLGSGVYNLVSDALPEEMRDEDTVKRFVFGMREHYSEFSTNKTKPYAGISELLGRLQDKGLQLAVLSNKADIFVKLILAHFFPEIKFNCAFGERPKVPRKPEPDAAFEIAHILGVKPAECVFMGDSGIDMQLAANAGMLAVGVLWGYRSGSELDEKGAKYLISEPLKLLDIIDSYNG
jgi:phosphoglycolate phosphatase